MLTVVINFYARSKQMASIFINYRRSDYEIGVSALESNLRQKYGADSILLDQDDFTGGYDWRAEMKASVVQCDLVLCVIGDSWDRPQNSENDMMDPLHEELQVAKSLGKPILVVIVGVGEGKKSLTRLHQSISWLNSLHAIDCSGEKLGRYKKLFRDIENFSSAGYRKSNILATSITGLFYSLVYPISHAGSALRGRSENLLGAFSEIGFSVISLTLVALSVRDVWSFDEVLQPFIRSLGIALVFSGVVYLLISIATRINSVRINAHGRMTYSLRLASSLIFCFSLYLAFLLSFFPAEVLEKFQAIVEVEDVTLKSFDAVSDAPLWNLVGMGLFNNLLMIHIFYIYYGFIRGLAAVIRTGWTFSVSLFVLFFMVTIMAAWMSVGSTAKEMFERDSLNLSSSGKLASKKIDFTNDAEISVGSQQVLLPIKIRVEGEIEINHGEVELSINKMIISNRTSSEVGIDKVYFSLSKFESGEYVYTDPIPVSQSVKLVSVPAKSNQPYSNIKLSTRLHPSMVSGKSVIVIWVQLDSGESLSLGNSSSGVLRW